jgi:hypothetical protein
MNSVRNSINNFRTVIHLPYQLPSIYHWFIVHNVCLLLKLLLASVTAYSEGYYHSWTWILISQTHIQPKNIITRYLLNCSCINLNESSTFYRSHQYLIRIFYKNWLINNDFPFLSTLQLQMSQIILLPSYQLSKFKVQLFRESQGTLRSKQRWMLLGLLFNISKTVSH